MRKTIRTTLPRFYRQVFQGDPRQGLTLLGSPGIDGVSSNQYVVRRERDGSWSWRAFVWYDITGSKEPPMLIEADGAGSGYASQIEAARAADDYNGRHKHTSVICSGPNPGATWLQQANAAWDAWEAEG